MASYIPSTPRQREQMLRTVGVESYRELYRDVPQQMYLEDGALNIPSGMSEMEVHRKVSAMAAKNRVFSTVLRGAGAYDGSGVRPGGRRTGPCDCRRPYL